ncbi:hypothetical protein [Halorussus limi]|nr:hypothetical protein [Halorussus limi]
MSPRPSRRFSYRDDGVLAVVRRRWVERTFAFFIVAGGSLRPASI